MTKRSSVRHLPVGKYLWAGITVLALFGCSLTAPRDTGNAHRILLDSLEGGKVCSNHIGSGLTVGYPQAPETLETSRIALIDADGRWDYFAGMRWADFLSGSIQAALIRSFSDSGNFGPVYADDTLTQSPLRLESEIRTFEAVYHAATPAPDVEIEMIFTLRQRDNAVVKQFTVNKTASATANSSDAIDHAFEQDFNDVERTVMKRILSCR